MLLLILMPLATQWATATAAAAVGPWTARRARRGASAKRPYQIYKMYRKHLYEKPPTASTCIVKQMPIQAFTKRIQLSQGRLANLGSRVSQKQAKDTQ